MHFIDWIIITSYLVFLISLGVYLGRKQKETKDYFLGGKSLSWWSIGLSTMATQLGAVSFISAPAFVGLRENGGLIWLGYEFALPFAMIILIWKVIPLFHNTGVVSIYEFLELRFDVKTRKFISLIFLLSRGFATGITIYATAIVVAVVMKLDIYYTIFIIGAVSIAYDFFGGIKAVVYSDVIQMVLIFCGIFICGAFGIYYAGGVDSIVSALSPSRLTAVQFNHFGFEKGKDFGFLPLLFGGFFMYISYYGFDQSQVQRELSARSLTDSRKSLLVNAFLRYPLVLLYCILGLIIGYVALQNPEFLQKVQSYGRVDYMIPVFITDYLPTGLTGLIVVAILAASMSSLDSALNSLSASTMEDFIKPKYQNLSDKELLLYSKIITLLWGIACTTFAFFSSDISKTVIESINKIGSIFYGPIAAIFILGIFFKRVISRDVLIGGIVGVSLNAFVVFGPYHVSWLWWNVTGFLSTCITGLALSLIQKRTASEKFIKGPKDKKSWMPIYLFLIIYGMFIILFSITLFGYTF